MGKKFHIISERNADVRETTNWHKSFLVDLVLKYKRTTTCDTSNEKGLFCFWQEFLVPAMHQHAPKLAQYYYRPESKFILNSSTTVFAETVAPYRIVIPPPSK